MGNPKFSSYALHSVRSEVQVTITSYTVTPARRTSKLIQLDFLSHSVKVQLNEMILHEYQNSAVNSNLPPHCQIKQPLELHAHLLNLQEKHRHR